MWFYQRERQLPCYQGGEEVERWICSCYILVYELDIGVSGGGREVRTLAVREGMVDAVADDSSGRICAANTCFTSALSDNFISWPMGLMA